MPKVSKEEETDFMANLLGDVSALPVPTVPPPRRTRKRKDYSQLSDDEGVSRPPARGPYRSYRDADSSSDGFEFMDAGAASSGDDQAYVGNPRKRVRVTGAQPLGATLDRLQGLEVTSDGEDLNAPYDDLDMDAFMDVDEESASHPPKTNGHNVKKEELDTSLSKPLGSSVPTNGTAKKEESNNQSWLKVYDSLTVSEPLGGGVSKSATSAAVQALEDDGTLRFFWLDYLEHEGKLYFVGKVRDRANGGAWASACVTVENLQRNLFVLPRERRVEERDWSDNEDEDDEDDEEMDEDARTERKLEKMHRKEKARQKGQRLVETDEIPELMDVYNDFDRVRKAAGVKKWRAKFVKRKYAFGEKDVPRDERQWLKVVYGFDGVCIPSARGRELIQTLEPQISNDVSSPNFSRIFGTNTSAFELLVLKRKIQGPCWLQIKKPHVEHKGVSESFNLTKLLYLLSCRSRGANLKQQSQTQKT